MESMMDEAQSFPICAFQFSSSSDTDSGSEVGSAEVTRESLVRYDVVTQLPLFLSHCLGGKSPQHQLLP